MALLFDGVDTNDDDLADLAMAAEMVVGKVSFPCVSEVHLASLAGSNGISV